MRGWGVYQVKDRTCKMQNNKARPKFFHCLEKKRETNQDQIAFYS